MCVKCVLCVCERGRGHWSSTMCYVVDIEQESVTVDSDSVCESQNSVCFPMQERSAAAQLNYTAFSGVQQQQHP